MLLRRSVIGQKVRDKIQNKRARGHGAGATEVMATAVRNNLRTESAAAWWGWALRGVVPVVCPALRHHAFMVGWSQADRRSERRDPESRGSSWWAWD